MKTTKLLTMTVLAVSLASCATYTSNTGEKFSTMGGDYVKGDTSIKTSESFASAVGGFKFWAGMDAIKSVVKTAGNVVNKRSDNGVLKAGDNNGTKVKLDNNATDIKIKEIDADVTKFGIENAPPAP